MRLPRACPLHAVRAATLRVLTIAYSMLWPHISKRADLLIVLGHVWFSVATGHLAGLRQCVTTQAKTMKAAQLPQRYSMQNPQQCMTTRGALSQPRTFFVLLLRSFLQWHSAKCAASRCACPEPEFTPTPKPHQSRQCQLESSHACAG
jgi:hypothetical protein